VFYSMINKIYDGKSMVGKLAKEVRLRDHIVALDLHYFSLNHSSFNTNLTLILTFFHPY